MSSEADRDEVEIELSQQLEQDEAKLDGMDVFRLLFRIRTQAFDQGYEAGRGLGQGVLRGKVSNQRRELRRLNKQLNAMREGAKLSK